MIDFPLTINTIHGAYRHGECTPQELILALHKQAQDQADYNAWITLLEEDQLKHYLAFLEGKSLENLPLFGIPFAIKDNIDLAGVITTAACPDFSYTPETSAPVVDALLAAGAIPLGKTNLDQFATGLVGTRSPYGEGKNVFNKEYISGGSSAGSAIATALGQVCFALGTDTAGSGRVPAVLNNLIGHKPTKGLLSTRGVVPACRTLDCVSIFALHSGDAAVVLDVAAQYDNEDPYARKNLCGNTARYFDLGVAGATKEHPASFRFGVPDELTFFGNAETQTLYEKAVSDLEAAGGTAVTISFAPFVEAATLLYEGPWVAERWLATVGASTVHSNEETGQKVSRPTVAPESMLPVIQQIIGNGNHAKASAAFAAQYRLAALKRRCDEIIDGLDCVIAPTTPTVFSRDQIQQEPVVNNSILGTYTNFMNLLDYSATAVPTGFLSCGVGWGVTLFGPAFTDVKLLSFAHLLQQKNNMGLGAVLSSHTSPGVNSDEVKAALSAPASSVLGTSPALTSAIEVVVCGAHLSGQPLNWQLQERGAVLVETTQTSADYKLFALSDGKRPGLVKLHDNDTSGAPIEVEVWSMPSEHFGSFVAGIPAPLGIGKVELIDGSRRSGFICDGYGLEGAKDISEYKSWRAWLAAAQ